jgi:hypothetical protein
MFLAWLNLALVSLQNLFILAKWIPKQFIWPMGAMGKRDSADVAAAFIPNYGWAIIIAHP